jgi:hypothetical protein
VDDVELDADAVCEAVDEAELDVDGVCEAVIETDTVDDADDV